MRVFCGYFSTQVLTFKYKSRAAGLKRVEFPRQKIMKVPFFQNSSITKLLFVTCVTGLILCCGILFAQVPAHVLFHEEDTDPTHKTRTPCSWVCNADDFMDNMEVHFVTSLHCWSYPDPMSSWPTLAILPDSPFSRPPPVVLA